MWDDVKIVYSEPHYSHTQPIINWVANRDIGEILFVYWTADNKSKIQWIALKFEHFWKNWALNSGRLTNN